MNRLQLVQALQRESGIDMSTISATTGQTGDRLRLVNAVDQAWVDIQSERMDWEFRRSKGWTAIRPRIYFDLSRSGETFTEPTAGDTLEGAVSGSTCVVTDVIILSGTFGAGTAVGFIEVEDIENRFKMLELLTNTTDNPDTNGGIFMGWGTYDFSSSTEYGTTEIITNLEDIFYETMSIEDPLIASASEKPLRYATYNNFDKYIDSDNGPSVPEFVTETPEGRTLFYPHPDQEFKVSFYYSPTVQMFSADGDTPTGLPTKYHMGIVWRALMYYGTWDEMPSVASRGRMFWQQHKARMDNELGPKISLNPRPLYTVR